MEGELEGDSKGDSKGDFRGDFKQDIEGDLLSSSGQVRSRSGLVQVWFSLEPKFNSFELDSEVGRLVSTLFPTRINIKHFSPHCTACRSLFMLPTIFHSLQCTVICQGRSRSGGLALVQFNLSQAGQGRAQGCLHLVKTDSLHQSLSLCLSYLSQITANICFD